MNLRRGNDRLLIPVDMGIGGFGEDARPRRRGTRPNTMAFGRRWTPEDFGGEGEEEENETIIHCVDCPHPATVNVTFPSEMFSFPDPLPPEQVILTYLSFFEPQGIKGATLTTDAARHGHPNNKKCQWRLSHSTPTIPLIDDNSDGNLCNEWAAAPDSYAFWGLTAAGKYDHEEFCGEHGEEECPPDEMCLTNFYYFNSAVLTVQLYNVVLENPAASLPNHKWILTVTYSYSCRTILPDIRLPVYVAAAGWRLNTGVHVSECLSGSFTLPYDSNLACGVTDVNCQEIYNDASITVEIPEGSHE